MDAKGLVNRYGSWSCEGCFKTSLEIGGSTGSTVLALPSKAVDGWLIHRGPPIFRNQPGIIRGFLTSTVLLVFGYALDPWHTLSGCGVSLENGSRMPIFLNQHHHYPASSSKSFGTSFIFNYWNRMMIQISEICVFGIDRITNPLSLLRWNRTIGWGMFRVP